MTNTVQEEIKHQAVIRISASYSLGDKGALTFETYADQNSTRKELHALVDNLDDLRARQVDKASLESTQSGIKDTEKQLRNMKEDIARIDAAHEGIALDTPNQTARSNTLVSVKRYETHIEELQATLAELELRLA